MCDRDSKREADRERRARIKAGTWDFPNGGAAEFAKAGAAIHTSSKRLGYSSQSPDRSAKPEVFTSAPAPAPRPAASAPRVTAPTFARVVSPAPVPAASTGSAPPSSMVAIDGVSGRGLVPQGYGYPGPPDIAAVSSFTKWHEKTETMLATLAANADIQDRRIAVLEASHANRSADLLDVARALAGIFSYAVHGGGNAPRVALPKNPRGRASGWIHMPECLDHRVGDKVEDREEQEEI